MDERRQQRRTRLGGVLFQCDTRGFLRSAIAAWRENRRGPETDALPALDTLHANAQQAIRLPDRAGERLVCGRVGGAVAGAVASAWCSDQRNPAPGYRF